MEEIETKVCPLCRERINAKAKKCPHCQHFQNKWTLLAHHPAFAIAPMLLLFVVCSYLLQKALNPGEDFESHRAQIHVVQSAMEFGERSTPQSAPAPTVAVVGTIQNDSGITWKDAVIGVQFFDKDHKLIDARQERDFSEVWRPGNPARSKFPCSANSVPTNMFPMKSASLPHGTAAGFFSKTM